jgi:putative nucleotidyltransferase with HDIG domain
MEAPGTYHHSIMVGNLGERAAEEVGADPLLVRVGAYYHDIGKLKRPYFFVENQAGGENVHETLEPEVSADIVRAHVRDGVELCEQYGVPPAVRGLIPQHHGSRLVSFFYDQAVEAAEAIGADPLQTRVAAYYHDIGKLSNPLAFIENQAGGENVHDELDPETSAQILKAHTADGIDIAYKAKLPKSLIAYIPQHHGTAIMSYFFARAKGLAAEPFGGPHTADGARAAAAVDERKFRHAGPKPQTREAALIMLADGVEASVRSLASRDEPAIRAMVARIVEERLADGQFDECDLTLRDVEKIKEAFVQQLLGMYHQRIAYPQNKVVEIESRRAASGNGPGA